MNSPSKVFTPSCTLPVGHCFRPSTRANRLGPEPEEGRERRAPPREDHRGGWHPVGHCGPTRHPHEGPAGKAGKTVSEERKHLVLNFATSIKKLIPEFEKRSPVKNRVLSSVKSVRNNARNAPRCVFFKLEKPWCFTFVFFFKNKLLSGERGEGNRGVGLKTPKRLCSFF